MNKIKRLLLIAVLLSSSAFSYKFADNRQYVPVFYQLVDNAETEILISHFEFKWSSGTKKLVKHLIRAKERGVKIKILLDDGISFNSNAVKKFKFFGFDAKLDSERIVNHTKLVVADGKDVLLGSTNFSSSSLYYNNEADIMIEDKKLAGIFEKYFNSLYSNRKFRTRILKNVKFDTAVPFFNKQYYDKVYETLKTAKHRIYIVLYGIYLDPKYKDNNYVLNLVNVLVDKRKQGVDVKVLLEKSSYDDNLNRINENTIDYLNEHGIASRFDSPDTITHAKVIVVDNKAILGSSNWGYGPFFNYASCSLLLKDKAIAKHYAKYFLTIFNRGTKG